MSPWKRGQSRRGLVNLTPNTTTDAEQSPTFIVVAWGATQCIKKRDTLVQMQRMPAKEPPDSNRAHRGLIYACPPPSITSGDQAIRATVATIDAKQMPSREDMLAFSGIVTSETFSTICR